MAENYKSFHGGARTLLGVILYTAVCNKKHEQ